MTDDDEPKNLQEAIVRLGTAKNKDTGEVKVAAMVIFPDGKEILGIGDTPVEAIQDAFQQMYPEMQEMTLGPQAAWSPALAPKPPH